MPSAELEEQHEKLRRAVDGWCCRGLELLRDLRGDPYASCTPSAAAATGDSRSASLRPVAIRVEPLEHSDLPPLIESDDVDVAKFVMVLSYDCIEISKLRRHASRNLYRQLLLFGHRISPQEVLLEGEPQKAFGQSLSLFMELYEIITRMVAVLGNLLQQMDYVVSRQDKNGLPYRCFKNVCLGSVLGYFGEGLTVLLMLDEILKRNKHVRSCLSLFKRMLSKVKLEVDIFDISVQDLDCLDQVVGNLEKLLDDGLFHCMLQKRSHMNDMVQKTNCSRKLVDAFTSFVSDGLAETLPRLDTWKEYPSDRRKILQHVVVFLFSINVCAEVPDKTLRKVIIEMLQVAPVIYVDHGIRFALLELIKGHYPELVSLWANLREVAKDFDAIMKNYLTHLNEIYSRDWETINDALSRWVVSFQSLVYPKRESSMLQADFQFHLRQIIQGILLANRMHMLALSTLDLHALLEVPIRKEKFKSLCHMFILLKVMANTFCTKQLDIIQCLPHVISLIQVNVENLLLPARVQLLTGVTRGGQTVKKGFLGSLSLGKDIDLKLTYSLSLVLMSMQLLKGNGGFKRQTVFSIAMDVLQSIGHVDIDFRRIKKIMSKLALVVEFQSIVEEVTDCGFLYWRKEMMRDWLSMVYIDNKFSWLQYLLDAFCDGLWLLDLGNVGNRTQDLYENELEDAVVDEIVQPLCCDIENDLRLHVHSANLKGSVHVNPTKTGVRNLSWYLHLRPLCLPCKFIDIRLHIECYLNAIFYSHTAITLYNRKVYSEMRQLAEFKYSLVLDDIHLPELSSGQGFNLAKVLKNIGAFTSCYSYNIIKQIFVERFINDQGRKASTILGVEQITSSIMSFGPTAIDVAGNNILGFLIQKMAELSRLFEDDILKSHLAKECIFQNEKSTSSRYPFAQAEQLNETMAKHPFRDHEVNLVDQICSTITEMGNGLGLVRLIYTSGSHRSSRISRYQQMNARRVEGSHLPTSMNACDARGQFLNKPVDYECRPIHTSYVPSFLSSILQELGSGGYDSLGNLYLIIPALTLCLVESKLCHKDKALRRDREPGNRIISDDGFVMGIACVLKFLGQDKSFDDLHWFASANKHLEAALVSFGYRTEQPKGSRIFGLKLWDQPPEPISPEALKEIEKVKRSQKEFKLLEYGLNVARAIIS